MSHFLLRNCDILLVSADGPRLSEDSSQSSVRKSDFINGNRLNSNRRREGELNDPVVIPEEQFVSAAR